MSGVIVKQMFKHPNLKSTSQRNIEHVKYIGTRAGVDKSIGSDEIDNVSVVGLELDYTSPDALEQELRYDGDDFVYAKYIDERPNSHGLFGQHGKEDLDAVQSEISDVNSFVWRTIISLKEIDAIDLGYTDKSKWQDMLRKKIPDLAHMMNIPYHNLRWVGAVHMEKGHPHVHVMFWEKQARLKHGVVSSEKLNDIRKMLTDEVFKDVRETLLVEKNNIRDLFLDTSESDINFLLKNSDENAEWINLRSSGLLNDVVPSRTFEHVEILIRNRIEALCEILPTSGRKALGYMPADVKRSVGEIVDMICTLPEYESILAKNESAVRKLTELYTGKEDDVEKAVLNATADLKKRMSQIILKGAYSYRDFGKYSINNYKLEKCVDAFLNHAGRFNFDAEREEIALKIIEKLSALGLKKIAILERLDSSGLLPETLNNELIRDAILRGEQKILSLNSRNEIIDSLTILKRLGFSESDAFGVLYRSNEFENKKIYERFDSSYYSDGLTEKGIASVLESARFSESDITILNHLTVAGELGKESVNVYDLLGVDGVKEGLTRPIIPFEFISLDKRVANLFVNAGEFDGEYYHLDDLAINEFLLDGASEDVDIISPENESVINDFESSYKMILSRLDTLKYNRFISQDRETNIFSISKTVVEDINLINRPFAFGKYDASVTLNHFTDNKLSRSEIAEKIFSDIDEPSVLEKKSQSLLWRLEKLKGLGILSVDNETYTITEYGLSQRKDLLEPERVHLRERLKYFDKLGVVSYDGADTVKSILSPDEILNLSKVLDNPHSSTELLKTLHANNGVLDTNLIKSKKDFMVTRCFYDNVFKDLDVENMNKLIRVPNYFEKSIHSFSIMMLSSGKSRDDIIGFLKSWSENHDVKLSSVVPSVERACVHYLDAINKGSIPVVSESDYRELFSMFDIPESLTPEYYNTFDRYEKGFNVNSLMRFLENEAKKDEMNNQHAVDSFNRQIKQKSKYASRDARNAENKKSKDKGYSFDK